MNSERPPPPSENAPATHRAQALRPGDAGWDGLQGWKLRMAAMSIAIGMICANLDMAIVQNALPGMTQQMHISAADSVWIITAYMLVTLTLLLPFAPLSDRIGYARSYLGGFVVFIAASLMCGLAAAFWELQIGRILQGVGSAAMMCSTTSLLRIVYPKQRIARAIGTNSTLIAVSIASAPSLSAFILLHLSWHWLFLINVPLGIIAFFLGINSLPGSAAQLDAPLTPSARAAWRQTFYAIDWWSVLFNIGFFTLLLLGMQTLPAHLLNGSVMLLAALVLGTMFVRRQIHDPHPMLPFDLLASRNYAFTIATSFGSFAAQGAAFVALPFFLQRSLGLDAKHTALVLTSWPIALALSSQVSSRLTSIVPISVLCATGQAMMALGLAAIALHWVPLQLGWLVAALAMAGAGFGFFQSPNNYVIVSSAPPGSSGSVGALRAATRTSGQLTGAAACGLAFLVASHAGAHADGASVGVGLAALMALFASVCSISRQTEKRLAPAR